jgi:hypothetical protein
VNDDLGLREFLAREVMGLKLLRVRKGVRLACVYDIGSEESEQWEFADEPDVFRGMVDAYESDPAAMMLVIERMRELGFRCSILCWDKDDADAVCVEFQRWKNSPGQVSKGDDAYGEAEADTLPRAVALAAREAVTQGAK